MEESADWEHLDRLGYKTVVQKYGAGEFNHPQFKEVVKLWIERKIKREQNLIIILSSIIIPVLFFFLNFIQHTCPSIAPT